MTESSSLIELIERRVSEQGFKLPVFNAVALELQRAVEDDADMKTLEGLIISDPALATEILRVSNSAFFSGLAKMTSIQQALVRLGTQRVLSLVMLAAQKQAFHAKTPFLEQLMAKLWQQSAASSGGCRWLAERYGQNTDRETAFLAGLLHDLGSLVILTVLDELCQEDSRVELTEELMLELIRSLHNEYGYKVMQAWELPEIYAEVALHHHEIAVNRDPLLQIVRIVDACCAKLGIGLDHRPELALQALPESQKLGIKDVHLAELEILLEDMVEQLS